MTADAPSPDTPTDPRALAHEVAISAARTFARGISADMWASIRLATETARVVVNTLADAGLLSFSGDSTRDPDAVRLPTYTVLRADLIGKVGGRIAGLTGVPALESPTREIAHQIADAVLPVDYVAQLNAERGRLYRAVDGEGSLRSGASGTPTETGEVPRP